MLLQQPCNHNGTSFSLTIDKCSLRSETKKIEFTDEEGQLCVTPDEVTITYCAGACDSYDSSTIYR